MYRAWAFWRRLQYIVLGLVILGLLSALVYVLFIKRAPTCTDGLQNGEERGVDCGGACQRVCPFDVEAPIVKWSRSFKITNGFYNAVAYVENHNVTVGTKRLAYTFKLVDSAGGTIAEKSGTTFLPPDSIYPIFEGRIATGDREPAQTFITLQPVTEWENFSANREQFIVNSRALFGVDSKPRLDASLTNTSLEDERDVEIITTIFDAAGTALTASRTVVPLFEGRAEKKVVFTWPEPIAKTLRSCETPSDVIMAIDLSGSMNNDGGTPPEPITSSLAAASAFAKRLGAGDQIGIVTFATQGKLARTLVQDKVAAGVAITALSIDPKEETGSTNIGDGIIYATEEFASPRHSRDARKVLVLFTDGKATAPDPDPNAYALAAVQKAKDAGITIFTIGLGNDLDESLLTSLASTPKERYLAADTKSLDTIYRLISTAICEEGPAVIDIVPKVIGALNDDQ